MKYNPDSRLMIFMTKLADLMALNLIFIVFCLPVVTIGAAWTALYYVAMKMVKGSQSFIFREFLHSFRENFRQSTVIWLGVAAVGAVLAADFRITGAMPPSGMITAVRVFIGTAAVFLLMTLQYLFPGIAKFRSSAVGAVKNAMLMAAANFPRTLVMCAVSAVPVLLTLINEYTMLSGIFAWILMAFAVIAVAKSCLLVKIFEKYAPASGSGSSGAEEAENEGEQQDG